MRQLAALAHAMEVGVDLPGLDAVARNYVPAAGGKVRAVCQCCGCLSRAVRADSDGEPQLWDMGRDWSTAPFPADCRHDDGSVGSTFTCPACNKRLHKGETLRVRSYLSRSTPA